jgi:hypothetical protein
MGLTRDELDVALASAVLELAQLLSVDLSDEAAHPGITAIARYDSQRRHWLEDARLQGQREQDLRDDDFRRLAAAAAEQRAHDDAAIQLHIANGGRAPVGWRASGHEELTAGRVL